MSETLPADVDKMLYSILLNQLSNGQSLEKAESFLRALPLQVNGSFIDRVVAHYCSRRDRNLSELRNAFVGDDVEGWYVDDHPDARFWPAFERYLLEKKGWPTDTVESLDRSSRRIMTCIGSPGRKTFDVRGLVLGYVQSGKTANFTAVIAKALDAGYRFVIVLSGVHNGLRRQTQVRLEKELVNHHRDVFHRLTTSESDFRPNPNPAALVNAVQGNGQCIIAVIKKNARVLDRLLTWIDGSRPLPGRQKRTFVGLDAQHRAALPTLIIDDECDQASVHAGRSDEERTAINERLLGILQLLPRSAYVGYTATPFANVLIDPTAEDLYPRDFIVDLPRPAGYFGAEQIFGREALSEDEIGTSVTDGLDMIRIVPDEHVPLVRPGRGQSDSFEPEVPSSLEDAIRYFLLASAARLARGHDHEHSSMLIHTAVNVRTHERMKKPVEDVIDAVADAVARRDKAALDKLKQTWVEEASRVDSSALGLARLPFDDLLTHLPTVIERIRVIVENGSSDDRLTYEKLEGQKEGLIQIAIGGNTMSRGLTLEGLIVSYFVRSSTTYDTLLQMGRWFGYRPGYADLPRIWMTDELQQSFRHLATVEEEIRRDAERYEGGGLTPMDFAIRIRTHPKLGVTSAMKMRNAVSGGFSFTGRSVQTTAFHEKNQDWLSGNLTAARNLIADLAKKAAPTRIWDAHWLFRRADPDIIRTFLGAYSIHEAHAPASFTRDSLEAWLDKVEKRNRIAEWNVGIVSQKKSPRGSLEELLDGVAIPLLERAALSEKMLDHPGSVDLGAIMSKVDRAIDLPDLTLREARASTYKELDLRRAIQGGTGTPLLLLYPIARDSQPRSSRRRALEAPQHLIGIGLVFPEDKHHFRENAVYVQARLSATRETNEDFDDDTGIASDDDDL